MKNIIHFSPNKKFILIRKILNIILFSFIINLTIIYCQENNICNINLTLSNNELFNNLLIFDNQDYQANNFIINKKGDLLLELTEYTENENKYSKNFHYLTKDRKFLFDNNSSYSNEYNINIEQNNSYNYTFNKNSISLFISIYNDININNEYLFSINHYNSLVELYNLNNDNFIYNSWDFNNFFNLDEHKYKFPYENILFELKNQSEYIIAFIPKNSIQENLLNLNFIIKFRFQSLYDNVYDEIGNVKYTNFLNHTIINVFLMDDSNNLVIISYFETIEEESTLVHEVEIEDEEIKAKRVLQTIINFNFVINFYSLDLHDFYAKKDTGLYTYTSNQIQQGKIFFKSIYLSNFYVFFIFLENTQCFIFELKNINIITSLNLISIIQNHRFCPNNYIFDFSKSLYDYVKITDKRIAFFYTSSVSFQLMEYDWILCILIINLDYDNKIININKYYINFEKSEPKMRILGYLYNDYLLFSTTVSKFNDDNNTDGENNYRSLFMIFGYANGKDSFIDISYYLSDNENYNSEQNIFSLLNENIRIDNNIFGYKLNNVIKLVSIPQEIIIYQQNDNELIKLEKNSYLFSNYNYSIVQNKNIFKNFEYYKLEYQYIIKESDDNSLEENTTNNINGENQFNGRINQLKFKLCHEYCETCNELGISENNQKCSSCKSMYQYDYWYFINEINNTENCVPEGYYKELETNNLLLCNISNYKYYYNTTNNKTICFQDIHNCPSSYPFYNEESKECLSKKECINCNYKCYINGECSFEYYNSTEKIYEKIKNNFISEYNGNESYLIINNKNNFIFQLTTVKNELESLNRNITSNLSIIDLKDCADLLKSENGVDNNTDLIILKYENDDLVSNGNEKSIQYEVYLPNSNTKLDLSVCSGTKIDIYTPINLNEKTKKLYDELKEQGYNLFDKNDKFYKEICSTYKSENGTDMLLADRYNDFFTPNQLICQSNCEYSDYYPDSQYLKCKCELINEEKIETNEPEKITGKTIGKSFYDVLKYSNYKVLICYKLVFRKVTFTGNVGSILTIIYFIGYLFAFILFCYKNISYVKYEILKLLNDKTINNDKNKDELIIYEKDKIIENNRVINIKNNLNNVQRINTEDNKKNNNKKNYQNAKIKKVLKKVKNSVVKNEDNNIKILDIDNIKDIPKNIINIKSNRYSLYSDNNLKSQNKLSILKSGSIKFLTYTNNPKIENENEKEILSDYELNDLDYITALKEDNRNFFRIYSYLLKREHLILFTFFNFNDFNIFSIKLNKFFLFICSDMAFNVLFFSDESMHHIYINGGKNDFISRLAQMIYSTIISQILQIFINYLTMTDIPYYKVKELKKDKNINEKQTLSIIGCIKNKIIIFYAFTFLLFLFFWYLISAFCAVYENTQKIFIIDSISSFIMGLLYPFILYLFPTILRIISLKPKEQQNLKYFYILSDKIPIF